ncbi:non-ribosomal peptide synthetase, partial [Pseudomonas viridiflava]|uniref:non-ribosomal peptide synthetase n=1 Tax=Pseudomonas viridiflava TaxID=33069 RepID=UPI0020166316
MDSSPEKLSAQACASHELASVQQGIWLDQIAHPELPYYNIGMSLDIRGEINIPLFEKAIQMVVDSHDALRLSFSHADGFGRQQVLPEVRFTLEVVDFSEADDDAGLAMDYLRKSFQQPFESLNGQLWESRLVRCGPHHYYWFNRFHHLVVDGIGAVLVGHAVDNAYNGLLVGNEDVPEGPSYLSFLEEDRAYLQSGRYERDRLFWEQTYAQLPPSLLQRRADFKAGLANVLAPSTQVQAMLPRALYSALTKFASERSLSMAHLLVSVIGTYFCRTVGVDEIVVGMPVHNRTTARQKITVGMFSSVSPIRLAFDPQGSLVDLMNTVGTQLRKTYRHQRFPIAELNRSLHLAHAGRRQLFDVSLSFESFDGDATYGQSTPARVLMLDNGYEQTPMAIFVRDYHPAEDVHLDFNFNTAYFTFEEVQRIQERIFAMLEAVLEHHETPLAHFPLIGEDEHQHLLRFNDTAHAYPRDLLIHQLIEQQAAQRPNACAVSSDSGPLLTYAELNQQANQLARRLIELGVEPDSRVAVSLRRGPEMVVALLGILKAGGAYVPIDPDLPSARQAYMLSDSAPRAVLTRHDLLDDLSALNSTVPVLVLDDHNDSAQLAAQPTGNPDAKVLGLQPNHLAYVLYTSGSTGTPKGVMNEHLGVVNRLLWARDAYQVDSSDRVLQKTPFGFDVSVWEFFLPLLAGAELVMARPGGHQEPDYLAQVMSDAGITLLHFVPSMLDLFLEHRSSCDFPQLRRVLCSGEALPRSLQRRFEQQLQGVELHNLYGPTEAAIDVTAWECRPTDPGESVPIGRPIANIQMHVLDALGQVQPLGVAGELHIGGIGVARGYLNQPELSAERFIADPFSSDPQARLYKTGDVGRWLANGALEYLGRNDFQVKIRGLRIEIGEIEAALALCAGVREVVVVARADDPAQPDSKRLVAYLCGEPAPAEQLRKELLKHLPEYMVPSAFVHLDSLPLTPNGKLDRKALPAPDLDSVISHGYEAPVGDIEVALVNLWQDLLGLTGVGRRDDFFELGGHSLLAVRLISQIRQQLGVELSLATLFAHPELTDLAQVIAQAGRSTLPDILPVARDQEWPLSFGQQRLWFLARMEGASAAYHMPASLSLRGALDSVALQRALQQLVARHEGLRTTFIQGADQQPLQRISPVDNGFNLQTHDLQGVPDAEHTLQALAGEESLQPFDLEQGPLIRGRLIRMAADHHVLLLTLHHIVSDGWSVGVLTREMAALYAAFSQGEESPLAPMPLQYLDYAVWQRRWLSGDLLQEQTRYWQQTLAHAPALLMLPTDRVRPAQQDYAGAALPIAFDEQLTLGLKALSKRHGTTLYMTVISAWAALLGRLAGQDDVVIGSPVANRTRSEIEGLVGLFVNTLAIRVDLSDTPTAETLLARVRQQTLEAQAHQDLPFEQVVEVIKPVRSLAHSPVFQAMLTWQDTNDMNFVLGDLQLESLTPSNTLAKFDLSLDIGEAQGRLLGTLEYATALFDESTMARYLGYFQRLLEAMVADDQQVLEQVPLLDAVEREHLLLTLNATDVPYPQDSTIHQLFEEKVQAQPDAIAVAFQAQRLSYAELNRQANRLAHHLIGLGIGADDRVAICVERGVEMMVGLLGVLKAGGAYVPLDPAYPAERLAYMIQDSTPSVVLTQRALQDRLPALAVPRVLLDDDQRETFTERNDNPVVANLGVRNLAYVIYTSGSTGNPKGVMIEHRGLVNYSVDAARLFGLSPADTVLQQNTLNFDLSVEEIFPALLAGATLAPSRDIFGSEGSEDYGIHPTVLHLTAAHWHTLAAEWHSQPHVAAQRLQHVRLINVTGDALSAQKLKLWDEVRPAHTLLINTYGPTEATVSCTAAYVSHDAVAGSEGSGNATIGKPMANTRIYLLDAHQQPVPYGVAGEIFIGGDGVARGYLNLAEVNAERFLADPFSNSPDARMYKTGDLARYMADGRIEYLGRNDFQVKVRGFRIELGEIETRLANCAGVKEAVVIAREDRPGDKRLVAYVVAQPQATLDAAGLRAELAPQLAEYMLPGAFVILDALPLTPNRKLDRKALPMPADDAYASRTYEAPLGEIEQLVAGVWQDLLDIEQVSRHDRFFELGGHSLLAVSLIGHMRQLGLSADVRVLFGQPTLAALAAAIGGSTGIVVPANLITEDCHRITPELLPLANLTQLQIDQVVATVPGGVANVQDIYPLAPLQEGILYHHMAAEIGDPYVLQAHFAFDDRERMDAFVRALQIVIDRHDILRTSVVWQGLDSPLQVVWRKARLPLEALELDPANGDIAEQLHSRFDPRHYRLDIGQAPLMRVAYAEDPLNQRICAMLLFHHMALDHAALEVVKHEIQSCLLGEAEALAASVPVPYRNYVAQARLGVSQADHETFFRDMLGDIDQPTLPFGLQDVQGDGRHIKEASLALAPQLNLRLRTHARQRGVSAASLVHLAWGQVLGTVSSKRDVVFGTVLMGRMQAGEGADRALGMFINTLPLRVDVGAITVVQGLKATHERLTALLGHEHAPLVLAQRCSGVCAPMPLFSALLNYRHSAVGSVSEQAVQAWTGIHTLSSEERTNYPLILNVDDLGTGFSLNVQAVAGVDARRICVYMQTALSRLVEALESAPNSAVCDLSVVPEAERQQLLVAFNDTALDYPQQQTVHGLFEAQVRACPEACAAIHDGVAMSYAELNTRANRLARHLLGLGVQPGDSVAILLERGLDLLASQLAVLKCAAVYIPLDINAPVERQTFMIEDSQARVLLTHSQVSLTTAAQRVDLDGLKVENFKGTDLALPQSSESVAYIMYTSGSTGTPKGVLVPHRAISRLVINNGYADFNAQDRVAFASNPAFDASTLDVWAPLLNGGCVVVIGQNDLLSPRDFQRLLLEQSVTVLWMTAGLFHQYASGLGEAFSRLRYLIVGGDVLDPAVIGRVLANSPPQYLLNGYGPTEATTFSATYEITSVGNGSIPIGKPVGNSRLYVLDGQGQPVPLGVPGELYIGGQGVAKGYLNRAELSATQFVVDPFSPSEHALMYRTGDLVRWRADGNLEYLGRNDDQVKIRGFRVELGEIETRLAEHPDVLEAVVLCRQDTPGDKRLVAYVTAQQPVDIEHLRSHLQGLLPEYMVPSAYVQLDALPLTANGKLDRKALPMPDAQSLISRGYEAPQGEVETLLASIWADVLKVGQVGRHDHFFELGGHSLLAVKLIERMRQVGLSADVRVLFSQPTLAALAAAVGGGTEVVVPANLIPERCEHITPDLLPLISLTQAQIDRVVKHVPGGAANVQDIYPLAPLQAGILYHHISAEQGDPYTLKALFSLRDRARLDDFSRALQGVINRHDILRTAVLWEGLEEPLQVVLRQAQIHVTEVDLDPTDGPLDEQLHERFDPRHYRLDVRQAPLMQIAFTHDPLNDRWLAMLLFHHLVNDATSLYVVLHEIQAHLLGQHAALGQSVPYRNYVAQARLGVSEAQHEAFFRDMLSDIDEPTLPFGLQDVQDGGRDLEEASVILPAELDLRLRAQARQAGVSAASLMHLAWARVLGSVSARDQVVFGTVLLGRMQAGEGADRALGMFINTLPLRVDVGATTVVEGLKATHRQLTALLGHEHAPLVLAQRCSGVAAPTPLFSALLNYRHSGVNDVSAETATAWEGIESFGAKDHTNYPLTLNVDDVGNGFSLTVQVSSEVGAKRACGYMQTVLEHLADALEQSPSLALDSLPTLPIDEREQLLVQFNDTALDYPHEQTIHGLFEAQAKRTPEALAVVHGEQRLTYRELNEQANRLAHALRKQGVQPDSRVGICVERGAEMVIGLLAILKAGGGYVPLDPAYPAERIAYMLQDSAPAAVLAHTATQGLLADVSVPVINLDLSDWQDESVQNPQVPGLTSAHLAYLIYTSGSTGLPKGVMIEHRNTVNFLSWAHSAFDASALEKTLFSTSLNFDLAVYECFAPLTSGGSIEVVKNVLELQHGEHDIGLINTVPSALKALLDVHGLPATVHTVNVAGEALKRSLVESLFEKTGVQRLCNLYGPSETTTYSSWVAMDREDGFAPHIGKPVGNTQFYLLDQQQQPVPLGVAGEIYIGGAGVARGYLNRDDLTAERFLKDPFSQQPAARMYRTGDLGRYLPDGNIEYLGRNDDQVKIRGFRIELGEIDALLAKHPAVHEAVVTAREDVPGDKRLVAYYTLSAGHVSADIDSLRAWLQEQLPAHMIPVAYVLLDALPLTPNGKLDRKALPAPDADALIRRGYEAPQGETETLLAGIWGDLLKAERISRHDQFFELGGHSLLAMRLISQIRQQLGVELSLAALFAHPELSALALAIARAGRSILPDIVPVARDQVWPLSFGQQRLWFLAQMEGASAAYHMPIGLSLHGELDRTAMQRALERIVARHEGLRTTFIQGDDEQPLQRISPADAGFNLQLHDLQGLVDAKEKLQALASEESLQSFDLEQGPLIRGRLIRMAEDHHVLLLTMHHIVSDGWSIGVLTRELAALYAAFSQGQDDPLAPLALHYLDYAVWQRRWLSGDLLQQQSDYWQHTLADAPALLMLPTDRVRPAQQDYAGAMLPIVFDQDLTRGLKALSQRHGSTLFMTVMAAWAALLGRLAGQDDVVIGTPVANRTRSEVEGLVGLFVNTLAIRVDLSDKPTAETLLAQVKTNTLGAQDHQDLPFEQVVEVIKPVRSLSHSPVFQAMLSWQDMGDGDFALGDLQLESLSAGHTLSKFDLSLDIGEAQGQLFGSLEYATALFDESTIARYLVYLQRLLHAMVADDRQVLEQVPLLDTVERKHLLVDLNATDVPYPQDATIHQLFEEKVQAQPDAIAVAFQAQRLSYAELNRQANRLAHHLIGMGIGPDDRVAICVERGVKMIVGLLGVLKAGAAYVPLDPAYPAERLAYMINDSQPSALLTQRGLQERLPALSMPLVLLDDEHCQGFTECDDNPVVATLGVRNLAYVIYTSGSTGNPKGVMIEHRGLVNYSVDAARLFGLSQSDTVLQQNTLNFDLSVEEIFPALLAGATLAPSREIFGSEGTENHGIYPTVLHLTAAHWHTLVAEWHNQPQAAEQRLAEVRLINVTGDALSAQKLKLWDEVRPAHTRLINTYGPTEATVSCTAAYVSHDAVAGSEGSGNATIGKPMANTRIYLLDDHQQPVPYGVAGEIFIGGDGVARGYLNLAEVNAERFLADPFSNSPDARM